MMLPSKYIDCLFRDAGRVELRHQTGSGWVTSWHLHPDTLLAEVSRRAGSGNLFTSLHHVGTSQCEPIANDDVDRYTRILFDLDPVRPTGTASTDEELQESHNRAIGLQRHMSAHGWPGPAIGMSGNGYHLQYRTALPNTPETREQLAAIYAGLHRRFSDDVVTFDRTVRNPGRICTLYGTLKRKGPGSVERPYRKTMITIPHDWRQVHPRQVERLANTYASERSRLPQGSQKARGCAFAAGTGDYASLDVIALFTAHGAYVRHIAGNVHGVRCPWSSEHSTASPPDAGDTVIFEADHSWPGFHCKHAHCVDRTIRDVICRWADADQFCTRAFIKEVTHV